MRKAAHKIQNNLIIWLILNILQWFEQAGFFKRAFSSYSNLVHCVTSYEGAFFREAAISSPEYVN